MSAVSCFGRRLADNHDMTHATVAGLVASYGYATVFIGTLLEGETILVAAGFAAHQGLLDWRMVVATAIVGGTLGDQCAFLLGRWRGPTLLARFPALARHAPQVHELLERHDVAFILSLRFLYGLRIAGPLIMGSSRVSPLRFALLNVVGAVAWAMLVSGAGYAFGFALVSLLADLRRFEHMLLLAILAAGFLGWLWRQHRTREISRSPKRSGSIRH
ncbi:MAG TPA: DedA family protein [Rhodocyclaceae bacterium]|nr:DedA family protein [Rhodocyclaceae bacterium]